MSALRKALLPLAVLLASTALPATAATEADRIAALEAQLNQQQAAMAQQRLHVMAQIKLLDLTDEANALTKGILASGLLPADADRDAAHIALATVHELDLL